MSKMKFILLAALSTLVMAPAAQAVVVVGGDNGWEVSFDGNINGLYVYEDRDAFSKNPASRDVLTVVDDGSGSNTNVVNGKATVMEGTTLRGGNIGGAGDSSSRIRTGLLPAFFSFNVRSPEVNGLTGSARISFAPQIQGGNTKNNFGNGTQAGAQIDLREVFFNVDGGFGTLSIGRTLSLFSRHNILTDMTLFGAGAQGGAGASGTTLGRIGYGYVYPQFNARISYKTPVANGFQLEVGVYDPSKLAGSGAVAKFDAPSTAADATATTAQTFLNENRANGRVDSVSVVNSSHNETSSPRWEAEATYATNFDGGNVKFFLSGLWQDAERSLDGAPEGAKDDATATGVAGGIVLGFQGFEFVASGYTGEALGTTLMLDTDSLDGLGAERDNQGYIIQATYTFQGATKIGVSYGASEADETTADRIARSFPVEGTEAGRGEDVCQADSLANRNTALGNLPPKTDGKDTTVNCSNVAGIEEQNSLTFGVYHDVTSWFKVVAEYTKVQDQFHNGAELEADVFAVGGFFLW